MNYRGNLPLCLAFIAPQISLPLIILHEENEEKEERKKEWMEKLETFRGWNEGFDRAEADFLFLSLHISIILPQKGSLRTFYV